jgi:hypothetical protein
MNMKECKHMKYTPQSPVGRAFGCLDTCKHIQKMKGRHFRFEMIATKGCPFAEICKHFEKR